MNFQKSLSIFIRLISRSCIREKLPFVGSVSKTLKLETTPQVTIEEDTEKLANYVCGTNLFTEGGEDVKLKSDSEYPDWLWKMRSPPPLEELDPNSKTYWNRIRKMREREIKRLRTLRTNATVHK